MYNARSFCIDPGFNLPKISLEKLDAYQRALIIGTNVDDE